MEIDKTKIVKNGMYLYKGSENILQEPFRATPNGFEAVTHINKLIGIIIPLEDIKIEDWEIEYAPVEKLIYLELK